MSRTQLEITPAKQEEDEHRQRVEVHLVAEVAARVEGGTRTRDEGDGDAQRHRHVHAQAPLTQAAPRAREERPGGKQHHRQAQHPAGPLQQPLHVGRDVARRCHIGRRGIHHHLHHAEAGHEHAPQRLALLCFAQGPRARRGIGHGAVAGTLHRLDQRRGACAERIPAHQGKRGGRMHARLQHAVDALQRRFDQPGAGGAIQPREAELRGGFALAALALRPGREGGLVQGVVERAQVICARSGCDAGSH